MKSRIRAKMEAARQRNPLRIIKAPKRPQNHKPKILTFAKHQPLYRVLDEFRDRLTNEWLSGATFGDLKRAYGFRITELEDIIRDGLCAIERRVRIAGRWG
jgi:hypothetical protein